MQTRFENACRQVAVSNRRLGALLMLLSLFPTCGERFQCEAADSPRPNVIILFADDLGYGDLACYGHPQHVTPHLDRMAAEGARLTQFYVPTPFCAPSRGTLLTGRYPWRHGVWHNPTPDVGRQDLDELGLPADEVTIAEALQSAGYATSCIGKWHLGHQPRFYPRTQGFDEYYGILYSNDMRPVRLLQNESVAEYPVVQATLTQRYTEHAIDFIRRNRERPFFLYLPHAMPHKPLAASEVFYKQSGNGLYADVIHELDASVGQLLASLREFGLDDRTLVFFTSDNGPWFGGSSGGLRGMKGATWEGGLRVPGLARWPGRIPAGATLTAPCGTIDLLPTILGLAGVPLPAKRQLDGIDLLPYLSGGEAPVERPLFGMRDSRLLTVRRGDYKLHISAPRSNMLQPFRDRPDDWTDPRAPDGVTILAPFEQYRPNQFPGTEAGDKPGDRMLFNLRADPNEQHDIAAQHPEIVARLTADYNAVVGEFPDVLRKDNPPQPTP